MNRIKGFALAACAVAIAATGCSLFQGSTAPVTPTSVCAAIAAVQSSSAAASLNTAQASNSALGQVWAYAQSGCSNGQPIAGVNASWESEMFSLLEAAAPFIISLI